MYLGLYIISRALTFTEKSFYKTHPPLRFKGITDYIKIYILNYYKSNKMKKIILPLIA